MELLKINFAHSNENSNILSDLGNYRLQALSNYSLTKLKTFKIPMKWISQISIRN